MKKTKKYLICWAKLEWGNDLEDKLIARFAAATLRKAKELGLDVLAEKDEEENKVYFYIKGKSAKRIFMNSEHNFVI